jgi:hypothetical protein
VTSSATERDVGEALVASAPLEALDLYRVPYDVGEGDGGSLHRLAAGNGRAILWPRSGQSIEGPTSLRGIPIFAAVAADAEIDGLLRGHGSGWESVLEVRDASGAAVSSVRRSADGTIFLPFDPNQAAHALIREEYLARTSYGAARVAKTVARRAYYRLRPLLPRRSQLALRRRFTRIQQRAAFPGWPGEPALHDLREWFLALLQEVTGRPLPQLAWWPRDARWAVVLTHDVERAAGYAIVDDLADVERQRGLRSAWYFVPERDYRVDDALVGRLRADGFEICVHGLRHDGRDLQPGVFEKRIGAMRDYAERWGATGFRAPSTQRSREVIARLGFDHDSSYSDVARFEPQGGGSCSLLPFFVGDVVELPITLPMDHTLFELLGRRDEGVWIEKAAFVREREGMALLLTHPDYLLGADTRAVYDAFLAHVVADPTAWHALPGEVSAWWRRRSRTRLRPEPDGWIVEGPGAADARVVVRDRPSPWAGSGWAGGFATTVPGAESE